MTKKIKTTTTEANRLSVRARSSPRRRRRVTRAAAIWSPRPRQKNIHFETRQPPRPLCIRITTRPMSHDRSLCPPRRQRRPTRRVVGALGDDASARRARTARRRRGEVDRRSVDSRSRRASRESRDADPRRSHPVHLVGSIASSDRSSSARGDDDDDDDELDDDDGDELDDVDRARTDARVSRGWTGTRAREDARRTRGGETRIARARRRRRRER